MTLTDTEREALASALGAPILDPRLASTVARIKAEAVERAEEELAEAREALSDRVLSDPATYYRRERLARLALVAKIEELANLWDRDDERDMTAGWASDRLRALLSAYHGDTKGRLV